jgi:hypothetical protein
MYNQDMSILYYGSAQQKDFIRYLNVHHTTFTKHLDKGTYYLDKYVFSRKVVPTAEVMDISMTALATQLEADRIKYNATKPILIPICPVILLDSENTKLLFSSKAKCVRFLKSQGHKADVQGLTKFLDSGIKYRNYSCFTSKDC